MERTNVNRPNIKALQRKCDDWNAVHGLGCKVQLTKDSGEVVVTNTRSQAQVLSGHSAVIWLDGVSGCYALDRVKPVPTL